MIAKRVNLKWPSATTWSGIVSVVSMFAFPMLRIFLIMLALGVLHAAFTAVPAFGFFSVLLLLVGWNALTNRPWRKLAT